MDPVKAFDALAHEARLSVFRLLIPAGREGLPAGHIGAHLGLPANSLSFHLNRLTQAGLLTCRRRGRQLFYTVDYPTLSEIVQFLAGDCCANAPEGCLPCCPTVPVPASAQTRQACGSSSEPEEA